MAFRNIAKHSTILLGTNGIAMGFSVATLMLNIRAIEAAGIGALAVTQSCAALFIGFSCLGTQQPVIKLGSGLRENKDSMRSLFATCFKLDQIAAIAGTLAFGASIVFFGILGELKETLGWSTVFYVLYVFTSGTPACLGVLRLFGKFHLIGLTHTLSTVLIFAASLLFFITGASIKTYAATTGLALVSSNAIIMLAAIRELNAQGVTTFRELIRDSGYSDRKEVAGFIGATYLAGCIDSAIRHADLVLLNWHYGSSEAGVYAAMKQVAAGFGKMASPLATVVFPEVSALAACQDVCQARRIFWGLLAGLLAFAGAVALFIGVTGQFWIARAFGPDLEGNQFLLMLVFIGTLLRLTASVLAAFVVAFRSHWVSLKIFGVSAIGYGILSPFLIAYVGGVGAATALAIYASAVVIGICFSLRTVLAKLKNTRSASVAIAS